MTPDSESIAKTQQATICIVESDPGERAALSQLLCHLEHQVRAFDSAEALLGVLDEFAVKVLVVSLELPGMSGLELLQALHDRGCQAPTIMLAGESSVATAVGAIRAGAVDFIQKPVIDRILLRRVGDALEHGGP